MKRLSLALAFATSIIGALAQSFPTISTAEQTVWYLIQFKNGGNAFTASSDGAPITTSTAKGSAEQQWKITGDDTSGYSFTNKKGYTLCVKTSSKNEMVTAASTTSGVSKFTITATGDGYELHPQGNASVSMNLWGGPKENRGVGLWDNGDGNNPVIFTDAATFESLGKISIIPYPTELTVVKEGTLKLSTLKVIAYKGDEMKEHAEAFAAQLAKTSGINLAVREATATALEGEIWFGNDANLPAEGYTLSVYDKGIEIKAAGFAGWFYALQTLKQILPREFFASTLQQDVQWDIPYLSISDSPLLAHRGYMLDIARHFFNKEEVKKVLDIMALYKMNRFHWHLTDDQGWRIEIPEYPKLTEVGAIRSASFSNIGDGQSFFDDTEYGRDMYYTQDELREVVNYAAARNIEIIPEVDLPGHMVAAVTAYPELSCDPTRQYEVRINSGISEDVLNIGDDRVIDFLKCIIDNVASIFPYRYIHIGGDECPTKQWETNEQCLKRVKDMGLDGVHQLQSWLVEELGTYIKEKHDKEIVVWDELLEHWNDKNEINTVVMAWRNVAHSATAADRGMKSIISPHQYLYLDFMQSEENNRFVDELYHGGWGINTVEEIYNFNPLESLSGREEYALGVQGNMWTETANDIDEVEYQLLPRLLALSEIGWLPVAKKDWTSFYRRLQSHDEIFELLDYKYAKHYIEPTEYSASETALREAVSILSSSQRGAVGYPTAETYDALQAALNATTGNDVTALNAAIAAFKEAPIVQPQAGKTYRIVSASTYYKRQYEGSSMYQKGEGVRFHYTPQTEPEELWQFTPTEEGYLLSNLYSGQQLTIGDYNTAVKMTGKGTPIRVDKATIPTRNYSYIPGAVVISAVEGYSAEMTGKVKRLSAELSGNVYAKDEAALCYNGTWRIEEVTDYTVWLQGLVDKCERIILTAKPGEAAQPTTEALDFLKSEIITPAKETLAMGDVSEEQYKAYMALYLQFQQMERTGIAQSLSEEYYYYLRNVWFGKYAAYNSSSQLVAPMDKTDDDHFLWSIVKRPGGVIYLINKATGTAAYPTAHSGETAIKLGEEYAWTLEERTLDGKTGICIVNQEGAASWYTNPDAWNYILMKNFWGACTWEFQQSNIKTSAHIAAINKDADAETLYDLQGRRVTHAIEHGVYVSNNKKIIK